MHVGQHGAIRHRSHRRFDLSDQGRLADLTGLETLNSSGLSSKIGKVARLAGFEPATLGFEARYSIQLS